MPTHCPNCDDSWERTGPRTVTGPGGQIRQQGLPVTSSRRMRTPVWGMRTGADRAGQILAEELLYRLYPDRAAPEADRVLGLASRGGGTRRRAGRRHFRDSVRQLVLPSPPRRRLRCAGTTPSSRLAGSTHGRTPSCATLARRMIDAIEAAAWLQLDFTGLATEDDRSRLAG